MLGNLDVVGDAAWKTVLGTTESPLGRETLPDDPFLGAYVDLNFEPAPNRDSRVLLSQRPADADAFGQPRLVLDWRLSDADRHTAIGGLSALSTEMGRLGVGRVRLIEGSDNIANSWPDALSGSRHPSGTARMSEYPALGVTDHWGRVHSTDNLFVSGSALFATIGYANPTLTIVAMAIRQAEHLATL